ncbi:hypothetical protein ACLVWU_08545 [Bdellovibrio sp. HCB290]|uniref:hypothetical protein n=1 Tax=Bdellovibrio sp. HCB290 TaxID=3394356 RepID=UPI0039B3B1FE
MSQSNDNYLMLFLIISAIWLVGFLIFRHVVCWYWKINRHIELQEAILVELKKINNKDAGAPKSNQNW